jgi:hypothetical protein
MQGKCAWCGEHSENIDVFESGKQQVTVCVPCLIEFESFVCGRADSAIESQLDYEPVTA